MAKITWREYDYREYNQGFGEVLKREFYANASDVINNLYEKVGDTLWRSINPTTPTTTTILLPPVGALTRETEVIIEEGR